MSAAMDANLALLRRSLCANPWLAQRISLFGTGNNHCCTYMQHHSWRECDMYCFLLLATCS
jgi:hypothetical protein